MMMRIPADVVDSSSVCHIQEEFVVDSSNDLAEASASATTSNLQPSKKLYSRVRCRFIKRL